MWTEKLLYGVLRVLTPLGPRYLKPSFTQRVYLLWIFRNFQTLPVKVLTPRQLRRIDAMCGQRGFVSLLEPGALMDAPVLGTLEQRPPVGTETLPRRPVCSVSESVSPFVADQQQF
jgi:hypothetical protein